MIKRSFLTPALLASLLYFSLNAEVRAQSSSCDTCTQLSTLNSYAQDTSTNTAASSGFLERITQALFGIFYHLGEDFGNTAVAFTAVPAIQKNSYADQLSLLHAIETTYKGNDSNDSNTTLIKNYNTIFNNYLLDKGKTFDENNASIAALYLDPSAATFYSDDQKLTAQRYIALASGAAMSQVRKPSSDWLKVGSTNPDADKTKIRNSVSAYYTYSAIESAIADNFSYIYGLNTGQPITDGDGLKNYNGNMISETGIFTYIQSQKVENPTWYNTIGSMGVIDLLQEQTILLGGSFLMLSRIEEDLRRILITNSAQTSLTLIGTQLLTQTVSQIPKTPPTF